MYGVKGNFEFLILDFGSVKGNLVKGNFEFLILDFELSEL